MSLEDTYRAVREEVSLEGQLGLPLPLLWQRLQERNFSIDEYIRTWVWEELLDSEQDAFFFAFPLQGAPQSPTQAEIDQLKASLTICSHSWLTENASSFSLAEKLGILVIAQDWLRGETLGLANQLSPVMSHLIVRIARGRYDGVSAADLYKFLGLGPKDSHYFLKQLMKADFVVRDSLKIDGSAKSQHVYFLPRFRTVTHRNDVDKQIAAACEILSQARDHTMSITNLRRALGLILKPGNLLAWEKEIIRRGLAEDIKTKNTRRLRLKTQMETSESPSSAPFIQHEIIMELPLEAQIYYYLKSMGSNGASLTELWKAFFHQLSMSLKSSMAFLSSVVSSCQCDFSIQRDGRAVSKRFYLPLGLLPQESEAEAAAHTKRKREKSSEQTLGEAPETNDTPSRVGRPQKRMRLADTTEMFGTHLLNRIRQQKIVHRSEFPDILRAAGLSIDRQSRARVIEKLKSQNEIKVVSYFVPCLTGEKEEKLYMLPETDHSAEFFASYVASLRRSESYVKNGKGSQTPKISSPRVETISSPPRKPTPPSLSPSPMDLLPSPSPSSSLSHPLSLPPPPHSEAIEPILSSPSSLTPSSPSSSLSDISLNEDGGMLDESSVMIDGDVVSDGTQQLQLQQPQQIKKKTKESITPPIMVKKLPAAERACLLHQILLRCLLPQLATSHLALIPFWPSEILRSFTLLEVGQLFGFSAKISEVDRVFLNEHLGDELGSIDPEVIPRLKVSTPMSFTSLFLGQLKLLEALGLVVTITNEATLGPSSSSQGNFPMNMEGVEGQQYDQQQQDPQQQPYLQQQPDCATEEDKKKDTLTWTSYALSIKGQIPPPPENVFQSRQQQSASLFSENTKSDLSPSSSDLSLCEADSEAEPDVPTFDFANGDVSNYWDYLAFLCLNKSPLGEGRSEEQITKDRAFWLKVIEAAPLYRPMSWSKQRRETWKKSWALPTIPQSDFPLHSLDDSMDDMFLHEILGVESHPSKMGKKKKKKKGKEDEQSGENQNSDLVFEEGSMIVGSPTPDSSPSQQPQSPQPSLQPPPFSSSLPLRRSPSIRFPPSSTVAPPTPGPFLLLLKNIISSLKSSPEREEGRGEGEPTPILSSQQQQEEQQQQWGPLGGAEIVMVEPTPIPTQTTTAAAPFPAASAPLPSNLEDLHRFFQITPCTVISKQPTNEEVKELEEEEEGEEGEEGDIPDLDDETDEHDSLKKGQHISSSSSFVEEKGSLVDTSSSFKDEIDSDDTDSEDQINPQDSDLIDEDDQSTEVRSVKKKPVVRKKKNDLQNYLKSLNHNHFFLFDVTEFCWVHFWNPLVDIGPVQKLKMSSLVDLLQIVVLEPEKSYSRPAAARMFLSFSEIKFRFYFSNEKFFKERNRVKQYNEADLEHISSLMRNSGHIVWGKGHSMRPSRRRLVPSTEFTQLWKPPTDAPILPSSELSVLMGQAQETLKRILLGSSSSSFSGGERQQQPSSFHELIESDFQDPLTLYCLSTCLWGSDFRLELDSKEASMTGFSPNAPYIHTCPVTLVQNIKESAPPSPSPSPLPSHSTSSSEPIALSEASLLSSPSQFSSSVGDVIMVEEGESLSGSSNQQPQQQQQQSEQSSVDRRKFDREAGRPEFRECCQVILRALFLAKENGHSFNELFHLLIEKDTASNTSAREHSSLEKLAARLCAIRQDLCLCLSGLCQEDVVCQVCAYDHHRYILINSFNVQFWSVCVEDKREGERRGNRGTRKKGESLETRMILRPWLNLELKAERLHNLCCSIVMSILKQPGISRESICQDLRLINPIHIMDILTELEHESFIHHICQPTPPLKQTFKNHVWTEKCKVPHGDGHLFPPPLFLVEERGEEREGRKGISSLVRSVSVSVHYFPSARLLPLRIPVEEINERLAVRFRVGKS